MRFNSMIFALHYEVYSALTPLSPLTPRIRHWVHHQTDQGEAKQSHYCPNLGSNRAYLCTSPESNALTVHPRCLPLLSVNTGEPRQGCYLWRDGDSGQTLRGSFISPGYATNPQLSIDWMPAKGANKPEVGSLTSITFLGLPSLTSLFPRLRRAWAAYSLSRPNLSAALIGWKGSCISAICFFGGIVNEF